MKDMNLLILEDNSDDAALMQLTLKRAGFHFNVKVVATRKDFIEALDTHAPAIILSDHRLPHFTSNDALEITRKKLPYIPFILVTGSVSDEFAANIIKSGADDYIIKDRLLRLPVAITSAIQKRHTEKEKREATEQLKENEEKYRSLVERVSDGFIALDLSWNFIYANKKAEELFGRPLGYLFGKNIWAEFPEAVDKDFFRAYQQALETQENVHLNAFSFAIDKWVESNIYPSATGISVFFRDVTEQKKAEGEARKSEENYRVIMERVSDAFVSIDKDWYYTYVNKQAGEIMGRDPRELIGKHIWSEFPEGIDQPFYKAYHKAMEKQQYMHLEEYYPPYDAWLENHIYPSPDGLSIFFRNITERKKAEEELRQSEMSLNQAQALAHISNWEIDLIQNTHTWSDEFYRIYGINKNEVQPSAELFLSFMHPDDAAFAQKMVGDAFISFNNSSFNFRFIRKDGAIRHGYTEWHFKFDKKGNPLRLFGILQDITERKEAEENLKVMEERMLEQKIQEQKKIARAIITGQEKERNYIGQELHDNINQILAGTKMFLAIAGKKSEEAKEIVKYPMELIDSSIEEIRILCYKLVTPLKNINLEELIRDLITKIDKNQKTKTLFFYEVPAGLLSDDLKLNIYRIIQEQINNIKKYAEAENVNITIQAKDKTISVIVTDDGKGFDVKGKRQGIGISNMINRAETFNGQVKIKSSPGKGCKTTVTIPY